MGSTPLSMSDDGSAFIFQSIQLDQEFMVMDKGAHKLTAP